MANEPQLCACGAAAIVTLHYESWTVSSRGGMARQVTNTAPKCMRCADRAAFPALSFRTSRVTAKRLPVG